MISVFDFKDYKLFLKAVEAERSSIQRGFRSRLAEVLECQNAYISQILNTHAHFSLEQGFKLATFLKSSPIETKYFLLLIEHARAGTKELAQYFFKDIEALRETHLNIKERVPTAKSLSLEDRSVYYSSWHYPTVHIIATIPAFRTTDEIAAALKLPVNDVKEIVLFLIGCGLLEEKNGKLHPGLTQIHLGKDSAQIRQHLTNWRLAAVQSISKQQKSGVHYSTVSSLSLADAEKLQTQFVQIIQDYVATIGPSKEETLYNFNLDFYKLI